MRRSHVCYTAVTESPSCRVTNAFSIWISSFTFLSRFLLVTITSLTHRHKSQIKNKINNLKRFTGRLVLMRSLKISTEFCTSSLRRRLFVFLWWPFVRFSFTGFVSGLSWNIQPQSHTFDLWIQYLKLLKLQKKYTLATGKITSTKPEIITNGNYNVLQ